MFRRFNEKIRFIEYYTGFKLNPCEKMTLFIEILFNL